MSEQVQAMSTQERIYNLRAIINNPYTASIDRQQAMKLIRELEKANQQE